MQLTSSFDANTDRGAASSIQQQMNNPNLGDQVLKQKGRLLRRSHHTVCTVKLHTEKLKNGYKMDHYKSYVFGGLIQESDGRFRPTNDLIEVSTKSVVLDKTQTDAENPIKPSFAYTQADEAHVKLIRDHGGIKPLPRREHQALLITNNRYMLIYGGKCDNAFSYKTDERGGAQNEIYNDQLNLSYE